MAFVLRQLWSGELRTCWSSLSFAHILSGHSSAQSRHFITSRRAVSATSSHCLYRRFSSSSPSLSSSPVRVRYAPSPTGSVHLGGLRTALYNYLLAKQHADGRFIIRIEDTDQKRLVPGAVDQLLRVLSWAGIHPDEGPGKGGESGPYVQSERLPLYRKAAVELVEKGHAYPCFCTPSRLADLRAEQTRKGLPSLYDRLCASHPHPLTRIAEADASSIPYTIRMRIPPGSTTVKDALRGSVRFDNAALDDSVLLKSDGFPTYHLAVVVDDHAMGITHVIRGEEWMTSAPKHVLLYRAFGWKLPVFAHLPLLLKPDGTKLSKRHADASAEFYIESGFLSAAVVNFVAFLGWNPGTTQEVFDMKELIQAFSLQRIQKGGAVVNLAKMNWFNTQHLRRMIDRERDQLIQQLKPALQSAHPHVVLDDSYISSVFLTLRDHVQLLPHLVSHSHYFFTPSSTPLSASLLSPLSFTPSSAASLLSVVIQQLSSALFDSPSLTSALRRVSESEGVEVKRLYGLLRVVLTREEKGPSLSDVLVTMGKHRVMERIEAAKEALDGIEQLSTTTRTRDGHIVAAHAG